MWFIESYSDRSASVALRMASSAPAISHFKWLMLFFFIAVSASQGLYAQSNSEEFMALKRYQLPSTAIPVQDLVEEDDFYSLQGQPFSGIAYERYDNGQLLRVVHIHKGLQHGPMYLWYPNSNPQMSANYRLGRLQGRFLGWYAHGGVIYDMMIGTNGYSGDLIENDDRVGDDETADTEQEGNDND